MSRQPPCHRPHFRCNDEAGICRAAIICGAEMRYGLRMKMWRTVGLVARYLFIGAAVAYAVDWSVFELRGPAMSTVTVQQFLKTPLKGNKLEFDYLGTADEGCSRTLFPQYAAATWNPPCWWLERHKTRWQSVELTVPLTAESSFRLWLASR
jgi:hypothetical protein